MLYTSISILFGIKTICVHIEITSKRMWYWGKHTFYDSYFALYVLNVISIQSNIKTISDHIEIKS